MVHSHRTMLGWAAAWGPTDPQFKLHRTPGRGRALEWVGSECWGRCWTLHPGVHKASVYPASEEVLTLSLLPPPRGSAHKACECPGGPVLCQAPVHPHPPRMQYSLEARTFWSHWPRRVNTTQTILMAAERQGGPFSFFTLNSKFSAGVNRAQQPPDYGDPWALNRRVRVCRNCLSLHSNFNTNKCILFQGQRKKSEILPKHFSSQAWGAALGGGESSHASRASPPGVGGRTGGAQPLSWHLRLTAQKEAQ